MKTRILLTLLCAMSLQTQAFFGSKMLSTAWTATASFCKEHPIAVATVAAACGISYWLYKKYTKTTSAMPSVDQSVTPPATTTSAATGTSAGGGDATEEAVHEEVQDEFVALLDGAPDVFGDFNTFESSDDIIFEDIDYNVSVTQDVLRERVQYLKIGEKIYFSSHLKDYSRCGQGCYGFKIMIGEKTVGLLIGEKSFNSPTLKIFMFVLYKNLRTDRNYKRIIQKIKNHNSTIIKLEADFVGIMFGGIKEQQRAIYKAFGFTEPRETNFEMSLMQDASAASSTRTPSASGAGAASTTDQSDASDEELGDSTPQGSPPSTPLRLDATPRALGAAAASATLDDEEDQAGEDDAASVPGSEYTATDEVARLDEVASEEAASEGASAASEVKVDIEFINIQKSKILLDDMRSLGNLYTPTYIETIAQNHGFGIWINSALVGIVIYEKNGLNIEIEFLALKDNFRGKIIIEKIIEKLRQDNGKANLISATLNNVFDTEKQTSLYHDFDLHRKKHASGGDSTRFYRSI